MSQHRKSPAPHPVRRRRRGATGRRTPVVAGIGMLVLACAGTAAIVGLPDGPEDDRARTAASAGENHADGQGGRDGQETQERARKAALQKAEQSDLAREKAELERAQAQERGSKRAEAAHTAQRERRARQAEKAREKAAAKREAAKEKDGPDKGAGTGEKDEPGSGGTAGVSPDESKLVALLNERRADMGLNRVEESAELAAESEKCSSASLAKNTLEHCGHEVLFMGGENTTPEAMLEAWFNSPGHKTALTYDSSTKAGAAIVKNASGSLVSAITIDS